MKGVVEIEFIVAVLVFITSISFVTFMIAGNLPLFHNTAESESIKSRSYQLSEMIMFDEGYPKNWSAEPLQNVVRIGFSSGEKYFIDDAKLQKLWVLCTGELDSGGPKYTAVKKLFGVEYTHDVIIEASHLDGSPLTMQTPSPTLCSPPLISQLRKQFHTTRLGILNSTGEIVSVKFTVVK